VLADVLDTRLTTGMLDRMKRGFHRPAAASSLERTDLSVDANGQAVATAARHIHRYAVRHGRGRRRSDIGPAPSRAAAADGDPLLVRIEGATVGPLAFVHRGVCDHRGTFPPPTDDLVGTGRLAGASS
jgi:hypothetical protein